ncbi:MULTISPECIES: alpha/beta hydrolase [Mycolicibacterium]|uniref:Tripeptidyl-peptidase B n=1 Tax=Mycolicibacterium gilvum (strain DSM 45189 / LMG 24558 / Spyr1) TaxID=278137 RepID=E6TG41_MYCSR|nr:MULTISPECIES: alpha/beta hydrolase [Mycolicibacterium]ADT98894.1 tripeptidyl-peptidase B [Mycolicibacterium gilvum Spyr1]MBV5244353.1 alpha/beta hydrolase [Mycolicibacterium sp. PAM1]
MKLTTGIGRSGLLLAMSALLVAGCSKVVDGNALVSVPRPGTPIDWSPCETGPSDQKRIPPGSECGMLSVPVDWDNPEDPDGDVAQLAVLRVPATGDRIGSLVVNPGGPGKSGVEAAAAMVSTLPEEVLERFDIVGFDPRGVANSNPAVWCNSDADNDRLRADNVVEYTAEGVAHLESLTKEFIQRCVDKMGTDFLANVGTASVVKDLDALRVALGDEKLTYLGYSYGTRIGASYAEQFPQNVRAMVLDGAIDPNADPLEADVRQAAAFQQAFDDYAADCAIDDDCPLGTDPAKAVEVYHSLVWPLVDEPAETSDPRGLSYNDAVVGTILPLYSPALWRHLTQALGEVKEGKGDTMLALADLYMERNAQGHYTNSTDVRIAVNCVDKPAITDRATLVEQDRRVRDAAPFMAYGEFTGLAPMPTCGFWPVPPTSKPHEISVTGLPPILVVSTTNDPATPYQAGVNLARQLGGALVTFEGTQHTVALQGDSCVDDIVVPYLIDGSVPPPDTRC